MNDKKLYRIMLLNTRMIPVIVNAFILCVYTASVLHHYDNVYRFYLVFGQSFLFIYDLVIRSLFFKMCAWHIVLIANMSLALIYETLYQFGVEVPIPIYAVLFTLCAGCFISAILFTFSRNGKKRKENIRKDAP